MYHEWLRAYRTGRKARTESPSHPCSLKQGIHRAGQKIKFPLQRFPQGRRSNKKGCRRIPRTVWAFILTTLQVITRRRNFPLVVKTLSIYSVPTATLFISVAFSASRLSFHVPPYLTNGLFLMWNNSKRKSSSY